MAFKKPLGPTQWTLWTLPNMHSAPLPRHLTCVYNGISWFLSEFHILFAKLFSWATLKQKGLISPSFKHSFALFQSSRQKWAMPLSLVQWPKKGTFYWLRPTRVMVFTKQCDVPQWFMENVDVSIGWNNCLRKHLPPISAIINSSLKHFNWTDSVFRLGTCPIAICHQREKKWKG